MSAALLEGISPRLGAFVREQRMAQGLSLADLAARVGMNYNALQALERGGRASLPSPRRVQLLADALGCDWRKLVDLAFDAEVAA